MCKVSKKRYYYVNANIVVTTVCIVHMCFTLLALYQVERFVLTSSSMTSIAFSWSPPIIYGSHITAYRLICTPLMDRIPTPDTLTFGPTTASMATVTGLSPGVTYSCSITTFGPLGTSLPATQLMCLRKQPRLKV